MNPTIKTNTGNSEKAKSDYAEVFLTRVPIKHQRRIGITEKTLDKLKSAVRLIAQNNTTVRSYASAILREHLREYKFLHEIVRKVMYDKLMPGDRQFIRPSEKITSKHISVPTLSLADRHGYTSMSNVPKHSSKSSAGLIRGTITSFTEAIILVHLGLNDELLEQMKSDVFNCQS